jgi:hypothetical protein
MSLEARSIVFVSSIRKGMVTRGDTDAEITCFEQALIEAELGLFVPRNRRNLQHQT